MGYAAVRALFLIGAIAATSGQYYGKDLGALSSLHHGVRGNVYAVDSRTLYLKDFQYDGEGPAAYFYVGSSKTPNSAGAVRLRDERGNTGPLRRYRGEGIALSLPDGKTLKDFKWFSVWCDEFSVNFGDVSIPRDTVFPRPSRLAALHGAHNVNSDPVVVVDAQTLLIPNFSYDGEAPDAKFWVGRGEKPSPQGIRIPDENGKEAPLRRYDKKTIVLTLPGELTVFDIGYFSVWCEAFTVNFGHVVLPAAQLQNVPPSLKMLGVSPQSKLNCEVLYDELAFEVRWAVAGDSIVLQLVAKLEDNDYMSFGISGDPEHSQMVGGDVAVAWVNKDTLKGYVYDYFLDAKSQCAGTRGSCPDEALGAKTNSVRLLNAALVNGYSIVTYQRSLKAADGLDKPIFTNMSQPIIWGLGPLNSKNEVSYHHHFTKGDRLIDFGRAPVWNCPMPEGEEEQKPPQADHSHKTDHRHEVNRHSEAKPSQDDHYQTHEIKPNPVPAPKPVPKAVPWEIPAIQCYEPPDGVLYAQMGPTGGKQGYSAITGHVGWGISWYINGLLIPEINVVRGKKYTFVVEGGTNPEIPAKYHPFYITNDSVGGYYHKSESEKQGIEIYAGVRRTRSGEIIPTGVGRLCNWTPDNQGPEADEYPSFGAYQRSLTLVCDQGNPGVVTWTPDKNTPDTVYYQCFTHRHLGWKINVVDSCDVQEPEESRVVEVVEPSDLNQEESLQKYKYEVKVPDMKIQAAIWKKDPQVADKNIKFHSYSSAENKKQNKSKQTPNKESQSKKGTENIVLKDRKIPVFSDEKDRYTTKSAISSLLRGNIHDPQKQKNKWKMRSIPCQDSLDGVFHAQIGPSAYSTGFNNVTATTSYDTTWYINGLLMPELNVVRGRKYTFLIEGGSNPNAENRYHPFYITNDPKGGYAFRTAKEKKNIKMYAGARFDIFNDTVPLGLGRFCAWVPDPTAGNIEYNRFKSFEEFQDTLILVCESGNHGEMTWTPDKSTPDVVYYQCLTHVHPVWKINVLDTCNPSGQSNKNLADFGEFSDVEPFRGENIRPTLANKIKPTSQTKLKQKSNSLYKKKLDQYKYKSTTTSTQPSPIRNITDEADSVQRFWAEKSKSREMQLKAMKHTSKFAHDYDDCPFKTDAKEMFEQSMTELYKLSITTSSPQLSTTTNLPKLIKTAKKPSTKAEVHHSAVSHRHKSKHPKHKMADRQRRPTFQSNAEVKMHRNFYKVQNRKQMIPPRHYHLRHHQPKHHKHAARRPTLGRPNFGRPNIRRPSIGRPNIGRPNIDITNIGRPNIDRSHIGNFREFKKSAIKKNKLKQELSRCDFISSTTSSLRFKTMVTTSTSRPITTSTTKAAPITRTTTITNSKTDTPTTDTPPTYTPPTNTSATEPIIDYAQNLSKIRYQDDILAEEKLVEQRMSNSKKIITKVYTELDDDDEDFLSNNDFSDSEALKYQTSVFKISTAPQQTLESPEYSLQTETLFERKSIESTTTNYDTVEANEALKITQNYNADIGLESTSHLNTALPIPEDKVTTLINNYVLPNDTLTESDEGSEIYRYRRDLSFADKYKIRKLKKKDDIRRILKRKE